MPKLTTLAIPLKRQDYSESSQIVTFLTREYGKITAIAKGIRRPRKEFSGPIDLGADYRISFYSRPSGHLQILAEAKLTAWHTAIRSDLKRFNAYLYLIELADAASRGIEATTALFQLTVETAAGLNSVDQNRIRPLLDRFTLEILGYAGVAPVLAACSSCGKTVEGTSIRVSAISGGVLCLSCDTVEIRAPSFNRGAILYLANLGKPGRTASLSPPARWLRRETCEFFRYWLPIALDCELKMLKHLY